MKKFYAILAALFVADASSVSAQTSFSLVGTSPGWDPANPDYRFEDNEDGSYSLYVDEFTGDFQVCVGLDGEVPGWWPVYGANTAGDLVEVGVPYDMCSSDYSAGNALLGGGVVLKGATFTITPSGEITWPYEATVRLIIEAKAVIEQDNWYIVGGTSFDSNRDWDFDEANLFTEEGEGVYTYAVEGEFGGNFKIIHNGAWATGYSVPESDAALQLDVTYTLEGPADHSYNMNQAEQPWVNPVFTLTVTDEAITLVVTTAAGIDNVVVENGEATYYNLQGLKVANPENGVFIKVNGNNVSKVRF